MDTYVLNPSLVGGQLGDFKVALELIKEFNGKVIGPAPMMMGMVVECKPDIANALGLVLFR
jgi:hypothetical protein